MRIVIAPDKFKGSLTAPEVIEHLTIGLLSVDPTYEILGVPVADGGEGTLNAALRSGFTRHSTEVTGPTGQTLTADFAMRGHTAVIEMALASGLGVLSDGVRNGREATSLGTGQLIRAAVDAGAHEILLGVGGSASTDGGAGLIKGLGARFLDTDGQEIPDGGAALSRLSRIDLSGLDPRLESTRFILASDVTNPLLGSNGAAAVYGPQKGLTSRDVTELDLALRRFVDVLCRSIGSDAIAAATADGSGAAGGVGYAALAVLKAERRRGADVVLEFTDIAAKLQGASLTITGEGSLDEQTLNGKAPIAVAEAAESAGVPVVTVCGRSSLTHAQLRRAGLGTVYSLEDLENDLNTCMVQAGPLLEQLGVAIGHEVNSLLLTLRR